MKSLNTRKGQQCDVTLTNTHLKCSLRSKFGPHVNLSISLNDILSIRCHDYDSNTTASTNRVGNGIVVHYARSKKKHILRCEKLVLSDDSEHSRRLISLLEQAVPDRWKSKQFLVVINPMSGNKSAPHMFRKKVEPIFRECGATFVKVYETTSANDVYNAFENVDLDQLDGIVVVGGDGFISSVATELIKKHQKTKGVDFNNRDAQLQALPCPIGFIPGGSGNYMINYLHQTKDPITAAVKILQGKTTTTNIQSLHQNGKLEGFSCLLMGFGLFGDMMHSCEKNRWMGNMRYKVIPLKSMLSRRLIETHIEYVKEGEAEDQWQGQDLIVYNLDTGTVNLCDYETRLVPLFADTALSLHITSQCSLGDYIKQLSKVDSWHAGAYDFDFIQTHRVQKYRVTFPDQSLQESESTEDSGYFLNLDGEVVPVSRTGFQISLHRNVVTIFGEPAFRHSTIPERTAYEDA